MAAVRSDIADLIVLEARVQGSGNRTPLIWRPAPGDAGHGQRPQHPDRFGDFGDLSADRQSGREHPGDAQPGAIGSKVREVPLLQRVARHFENIEQHVRRILDQRAGVGMDFPARGDGQDRVGRKRRGQL